MLRLLQPNVGLQVNLPALRENVELITADLAAPDQLTLTRQALHVELQLGSHCSADGLNLHREVQYIMHSAASILFDKKIQVSQTQPCQES